MGKMMISLSEKAEAMVRHHIKKAYHNRVGGLSIFFEQIVTDHFAAKKKVKPIASSGPQKEGS